MTETEERWAERVEAWRASGQTSREYCEGRAFTAGGLRHWAYRLRKAAGMKATALARRSSVRLVRVERVADRAAPAVPVGAALIIEIGGARMVVPPGCDVGTVKTVLEALAATVGGRS